MIGVFHTACLFAIALLLAAVGGCTSPNSEAAVEARTKLVGMPVDDFLLCMGPPAARKKEGGIDFLIYKSTSAISTSASRGYTSRSSKTKVSACTANVAIRDGKVLSINYVGDTGDEAGPYENCFEIVANCMGGHTPDPLYFLKKF